MAEKLFGVAYYPELWDISEIDNDIKKMKDLGINLIRIGEFAWSLIEPEINNINLDFFKQLIKKFNDNGIKSCFGTPTATPPIWLTHGHPERLVKRADGTIMSHGSRQHVCLNNDYFRERAEIVVEKIAKEIGNEKGLIAWQIDNEFNCHNKECFCDNCKEKWHKWLKDKYETVEKLNKLWGTGVWSQKYQSFEQVPQPVTAPFLHNASLLTAYQRFSNDMTKEFQQLQINAIRKYSDVPITHNGSRFFAVNVNKLFSGLDFASFDAYYEEDSFNKLIFEYDFWRGVKSTVPFWVMETAPGQSGCLINYRSFNSPEFVRAEAAAAFASGADAFCFWLWRQQRTGAELMHTGIISSWGEPSAAYVNAKEVKETAKVFDKYLNGYKPLNAKTALVYSDDAKIYLSSEDLKLPDYNQLIQRWYNLLLKAGIPRDIIFENEDLAPYDTVMTPYMPYISEEFINKAVNFVISGGTWILGPQTGYRTEEHTANADYALGKIEKILGIKCLYTFIAGKNDITANSFGIKSKIDYITMVFDKEGVSEKGVIENGMCKGLPFVIEKEIGEGKIILIGSTPIEENGDAMIMELFKNYLGTTQIKTDGCAVFPMKKNNSRNAWVVINYNGNGGSVYIPNDFYDETNAEKHQKGYLKLLPFEYKIIWIETEE